MTSFSTIHPLVDSLQKRNKKSILVRNYAPESSDHNLTNLFNFGKYDQKITRIAIEIAKKKQVDSDKWNNFKSSRF